MNYLIRDATVADLEAVFDLNQSEVPHVGSVTLDDMHTYFAMAVYFRVVCNDAGEIIAFLVGLGPGADYQSPNYRWFDTRYEKFAYIDRIAVAPQARRLGIAAALYEDFARLALPWAPILCCEVNLQPPNPVSMDFHRRVGFSQLGTLESPGSDKKVAMLVKDIPS